MIKPKIFIAIASVVMLSASCSLFGTPIISGVAKSVNGGADWQFSNTVKNVKNGTLGGLNISKMDFDPDNRQVVYAGAYNGGLYKSEDSGGSWSNILSNIFVYDFAVHPKDPKTIYVAGFFGDHGRVVVTHDGGGSWQQIFNEGSSSNPVRRIAINPLNTQQIIIGTEAGTIVKSSDAGISWRLIRDCQDRINQIIWRPNAVYVLLKSKGILKSLDSGENYTSLNNSVINTTATPLFASSATTIGNFNQIFVDTVTPNLIYATTDKGLYKTVDEGQHWTLVSLPVKGSDLAARAVAIANNSSNVVYTSIGSTIYKSVDAGQTWQTQRVATDGFINYILIDPQLPQIVYAGIYGK